MTTKSLELAFGEIRKHIAEELTEEDAVHLLILVNEAAREHRIWSARGLKENLAQVLDGVISGRPQIIRRTNDTEPMVLISVKHLVEAFKPTKPFTLWDSIRQSFPSDLSILPDVQAAPIDKRSLPSLSAQHAEQKMRSASA